jgi:hypothetical protein
LEFGDVFECRRGSNEFGGVGGVERVDVAEEAGEGEGAGGCLLDAEEGVGDLDWGRGRSA